MGFDSDQNLVCSVALQTFLSWNFSTQFLWASSFIDTSTALLEHLHEIKMWIYWGFKRAFGIFATA
jgi:hypothetical protein